MHLPGSRDSTRRRVDGVLTGAAPRRDGAISRLTVTRRRNQTYAHARVRCLAGGQLPCGAGPAGSTRQASRQRARDCATSTNTLPPPISSRGQAGAAPWRRGPTSSSRDCTLGPPRPPHLAADTRRGGGEAARRHSRPCITRADPAPEPPSAGGARAPALYLSRCGVARTHAHDQTIRQRRCQEHPSIPATSNLCAPPLARSRARARWEAGFQPSSALARGGVRR
jgi:hypothetical protein